MPADCGRNTDLESGRQWLTGLSQGVDMGVGVGLGPSDEDLLSREPHPDSFRSLVAHLVVTGHFLGVLPVPSCTNVDPR